MTELGALLSARRLFILLGPYGSGKTEIAVNLALRLARSGRRTALADLDIVNPYFRSREKGDILAGAGVELIAPARETWAADLPALPPKLWTLIQDSTLAVVLAAFSQALIKAGPAVWYVLNQARQTAQSPQAAAGQLRETEARAKIPVTGLINNTHLMADTDAGLVLSGARYAREVASLTGLPVVCHSVQQSVAGGLSFPEPVLPLELTMKRPWE